MNPDWRPLPDSFAGSAPRGASSGAPGPPASIVPAATNVEAGDDDIARRIRAYLVARRARDLIIDDLWFADPVWDILLDLVASRHEGRDIVVTSACIAAAVPATTALRWIEKMEEAGLLSRAQDKRDKRRSFVRLDPEIAARVEQWVRRYLPLSVPPPRPTCRRAAA